MNGESIWERKKVLVGGKIMKGRMAGGSVYEWEKVVVRRSENER
jgi:hypothetical protein